MMRVRMVKAPPTNPATLKPDLLLFSVTYQCVIIRNFLIDSQPRSLWQPQTCPLIQGNTHILYVLGPQRSSTLNANNAIGCRDCAHTSHLRNSLQTLTRGVVCELKNSGPLYIFWLKSAQYPEMQQTCNLPSHMRQTHSSLMNLLQRGLPFLKP